MKEGSGGDIAKKYKSAERGGRVGGREWFTVEEGEIKAEREAKKRREEVIEGDCFGECV